MAQTIVAAPQTVAEWLAERGLVVGARVGSCTVARLSGTVVAIRSTDDITVKWDTGITQSVSWASVAPYGYTIEVEAISASASQWASAACHLENRIEHVRIDGERFAIVTSGNSGKVYRLPADASRCPCEWNTRTRTRCSHILAVELQALADELAAETSETISVVFPPCRVCGHLTDGAGRVCDRCCAAQTRRLEIAERQAARAA